jgi:hypothetical protein
VVADLQTHLLVLAALAVDAVVTGRFSVLETLRTQSHHKEIMVEPLMLHEVELAAAVLDKLVNLTLAILAVLAVLANNHLFQ